MKTNFIINFLAIWIIPLSVFAQQATPEETLLNKMSGKWTLQGTIAGSETTHDINAAWILGHQYIQLIEKSHEKDLNGNPSYEAMVFIAWEEKLNQYSCLWLDNTGNGGLTSQAAGHAKANGNKIEFLFRGADNSIFHTTFVYGKDTDTWQWLMDGEENGKLQPFARVKLTRDRQ